MFVDRKGLRIFIYRETIDMRCGFEKLHSYCVHKMQAVMDQGHVYVFFEKKPSSHEDFGLRRIRLGFDRKKNRAREIYGARRTFGPKRNHARRAKTSASWKRDSAAGT